MTATATAPLSERHRPPRFAPLRLLGLLAALGLDLAAGWGSGAALQAGDRTIALTVPGCLLWVSALLLTLAAAGKPPNAALHGATALPLAFAVSLGGLDLAFALEPPLLHVLTALALVCAAAAVPSGERRLRRAVAAHRADEDRARRLDARGRTVTGRIVAVDGTGTTVGERPELDLTVRYLVDGAEHTTVHRDTHPVSALPAVGGAVPVRYDPADPSVARVGPAPADAVPQERTTGPAEELERLGALHARGALTAAEYAAARRLVLDGPY